MMGVTRDFSSFARPTADGLLAMEVAVEGMKCAGCMGAIERGLAATPGIRSARVNLALSRATVLWEPAAITAAGVVDAVTALGFRAHPLAAPVDGSAAASRDRQLLRGLGVAGFSAMNIMLLSVSVWSGNASDITPETRDLFHWLSGLIALPTAAYSGRVFFDSALAALRRRAVNMDVPISLGILLALGMSVVETLNHAEHVYFDSAVMLIFFLLIGRTCEELMRRRTRDHAVNLAALKAETAVKFLAGGQTLEMPISAIRPGDHVLVRPGDRVAVDGIVISGQSELDQSLITGETLPQAVAPGSSVHAGALNGAGTLEVRVTAAEAGTLLDEVSKLLARASEIKAGYVQLADRAARLYAPLVHLTALLTLLGWLAAGLAWQQALVIAITVLIITCPCALGLAIPVVQVVASGALFRQSVLLNGGDVIERLAEVDTIVFDKTGTLTLPEPVLVNIGEVGLCRLARAGQLALASRHPLAQALVAASGATQPIPATEEPGAGVRASVDGVEWRLGSLSFCAAETEGAAVAAAHPGASLIAFRRGEEVTVFALHQALRPAAAATIAALQAEGYAIEILSGDRAPAVAETAAALGIASASAGLKPADKIARLDALKAAGRKVLMVGDGLNDAPALAAAHASLSPVSAVHLSQAAADGVYLGQSLAPVAATLATARKARRLMMQNLWFAVAYNAVAVPLAIAGHATPLVAALAMSGSSVVVTLNALRAARTAAPLPTLKEAHA
jgi:Cu2+-exporting ATPase